MIDKNDRLAYAAAHAAHEANRAWCVLQGDGSQPHWENAPEWQVESALAGIEGVVAGNTPEQSHESWLAVKRADGWIYGPEKNVEAKTHPCMVEYAALSPAQRAKDHIFVAVVRAFYEANASLTT